MLVYTLDRIMGRPTPTNPTQPDQCMGRAQAEDFHPAIEVGPSMSQKFWPEIWKKPDPTKSAPIQKIMHKKLDFTRPNLTRTGVGSGLGRKIRLDGQVGSGRARAVGKTDGFHLTRPEPNPMDDQV